MSERRAGRVFRAHRSSLRYTPQRGFRDAPVRKRIEEIALVRVRYGYRRIYTLMRREGWGVNHKQDLPALFGVASVTGLISSEGQETPVRIAFFAHCRA